MLHRCKATPSPSNAWSLRPSCAKKKIPRSKPHPRRRPKAGCAPARLICGSWFRAGTRSVPAWPARRVRRAPIPCASMRMRPCARFSPFAARSACLRGPVPRGPSGRGIESFGGSAQGIAIGAGTHILVLLDLLEVIEFVAFDRVAVILEGLHVVGPAHGATLGGIALRVLAPEIERHGLDVI